MAADENNITAADIQRVSEVDFVSQFTNSVLPAHAGMILRA